MRKLNKFEKKLLLGYILWIILQFGLLSAGHGFDEWDSDFWPWNGRDIQGKYFGGGYDWFEFFVYSAIPPIGYGIYLLIKSIKNDN